MYWCRWVGLRHKGRLAIWSGDLLDWSDKILTNNSAYSATSCLTWIVYSFYFASLAELSLLLSSPNVSRVWLTFPRFSCDKRRTKWLLWTIICLWSSQLTSQWVIQPTSSTAWPTQSVDPSARSVSQWNIQPALASHSVERSISRAIGQSVDRLVGWPASQPANRLANHSVVASVSW